MTFKVYETADETETSLGEVQIDLASPEKSYTLDNGIIVEVTQYYPDYELDDGEPRSVTKFPRNPAFVFTIYPPDSEQGEVSFVGIGQNIDPTNENQYKLGIVDFETRYASGLTVRKDYTLPLFGIGAAIFMIGVIQGMYWQHRRVWINPKDNGLLVAAHTNKNWFGLKKDIEKAIADTNINMVVDQEEKEREETKRA